MTEFVYVLPNVSTMRQRGGITGRLEMANRINSFLGTNVFELVEVPGDFVKKPSEVRRTGLSLCSTLDPSSVACLYDRETAHKPNYVLHTEPSLYRRSDTDGCTPPLKWYDLRWVESFKAHVYAIVDYLGGLPSVIEVHPGGRQKGKNTIQALLNGIRNLSDGLTERYGSNPVLNLENRTGHIVSRGKQIQTFWEHAESSASTDIHIALDIQQLYTQTKQDFQDDLTMIPAGSIGCIHIHELHGVPQVGGPIDWGAVGDYIRTTSLPSVVYVLPEVHHAEQVCPAYRFCREVLGLWSGEKEK